MFLLRTCCAFGIEEYLRSQATESFSEYDVAESCLGFDDKLEYTFTVSTNVKQDQNIHNYRGKDIKLGLSSAILYLFHRYKPYKLPYSIEI